MIFVTTGVSGAPFDRLLRVIDAISTDEELVVQHGPSSVRPKRALCVAFLPFGELTRLINDASRVITHAGAGSILVALSCGKRPTVVPRRPEYGELVDDHQLHFARHLAAADLVQLVEEPEDLPQALVRPTTNSFHREATPIELVSDLERYLHAICAPRGDGDRRDPESVEVVQ